jgi:hypothetical protein
MNINAIDVPLGFKPVSHACALHHQLQYGVDLKATGNATWRCLHNDVIEGER